MDLKSGSLNLNYKFDENLHEVLECSEDVKKYVQLLLEEVRISEDSKEKARLLSMAGVYFRLLKDFPRSLECLENAMRLNDSVSNRIRLGHTYQWKKDFNRSNLIFEKLLQDVESGEETLLDYVYQHAGKNYFDQARYEEALNLFERALEIRISKNVADELIDSSRLSVKTTKSRLKKN